MEKHSGLAYPPIDSVADAQKHAYVVVETQPDMHSFLYQRLNGSPYVEDLNVKYKINAPYRTEMVRHYITLGDVVQGEQVVNGKYPVVVQLEYVWIRQKLFVWWHVSGIYADYDLCSRQMRQLFPRAEHVRGDSNLLHHIHRIPP